MRLQTLANLNYLGSELLSPWAMDKVKILRFEDFESNVRVYSQHINNYFGLQASAAVNQWFLENVKTKRVLEDGHNVRNICDGLMKLLQYN